MTRSSSVRRNIGLAALFSLFLALLPYGPHVESARATAGTGAITIVSTGGTSEGTDWNFSSGTITTVDGDPASIKASDVVGYLNSGNLTIQGASITVNASVVATTGSSSLTLSATGDIDVKPAISLTTLGGNMSLLADSEGNGVGGIRIGTYNDTDSLLTSNGGDITLAGGGRGTSGSGNTGFAGLSSFSQESYFFSIGILSATVDADGGDIVVKGYGGSEDTGLVKCVQVMDTLRTSGSGTVLVNGDCGSTPANEEASDSQNGVGTRVTSTIETASGAITVIGRGNVARTFARGITWSGTAQSTSGTIFIRDETANTSAVNYTGLYFYTAQLGQGGLGSSSSDVSILADEIQFDGANPLSVNTTGTLAIAPAGSDFSSTLTIPNTVTISNITGMTVGSSTNTQDVTLETPISSAGAVTIYAGDVDLNASLTLTSGNFLAKASGNIEVDGDITTAGGDIILWADSDASGDDQNAGGHIALFSGHSLDSGTGGGDIVLAGGADSNSDGVPDGYAFGAYADLLEMGSDTGNRGTSGVYLSGASEIDSGSGDVLIRGHGTGSASNFQMGVRLQQTSISAAGIEVYGKGSVVEDLTGSSNWGVAVLGSQLSASGNISVSGWGGTAGAGTYSANQNGIYISNGRGTDAAVNSSVQATGSGTITLTGVGTASDFGDIINPFGIFVATSQTLSASTGDIVLHGTTGYTSSGTTSTSAVRLDSNASSSGGNVQVTGVAGPSATGGGLHLTGVTATNGRITLDSPGAVTQTAAFSASELALVGAGSFTLTNTSNGFGTVAGGSAGAELGSVSVYDQSGGLTIGAVGALEGISASGDILIETGSGDITLARSLSTASTSNSAITVNAGKITSAGTASGGNIVVSGSPTVSAGTGSIVKLFSGSESASTGVTSLVGGLSKVYYGVDESSSLSPTPPGGAQYALYRSSVSIPQLSSLSDISSTVGSSSTLTSPTATNQSSNAVPGSVSWSTSNSSVASLSGTTLSYGSAGTAVITATFTPTDTTNYSVATTTFTVTVSAAGGGGGSSSSSSSSAVTSPPATPTVTPTVTPRQTRLTLVGPNTDPVPRPVERLGLRFDPDAPSRATVGGVPSNLVKTPVGSDRLSITAGAFQFGVSLADADGAEVQTETPSQSPELFVPRGQSAAVSGKGSYPGSFVQLFLPGNDNDSRELARIPVRSDGTFASDLSFQAGALELPVPIGRQVLQVVGYDELGNQTVVDMTVNIGQGVLAPEPNRQAGALPALTAGQSLATSGGIPETVSVTGVPEAGNVVVEGSGWVISVNADRDNGVVENEDGNVLVRLNPSSVGTTFGNGFLPGTLATVWLFSEPTLMTTVTVDDNGEFSAEFLVDARLIAPGEHTLQVQGVGSDGYIKAANLGVLVEEPVELATESASGLLWWIVGAFLLVLLFLLLLLARGRRSQEQ